MINNYHVVVLIPARGGSKRLPKKNIKLLDGKPLIAWSIECAKKSQYVDQIIVSTDSQQIKDISENYGANVPFIRPDYLSNDTATTYDVLQHAIESLALNKPNILLVLLQPTSPLRTTEELDKAIEYFIQKNALGVVSVSEMEHSPLWANVLPDDNNMLNFLPNNIVGKRSQDLPTYYRINGSIYIYDIESLLKNKKVFFDERVFAFVTVPDTSVDIDTMLDFKIAESILEYKKENNEYIKK